MSYSPNDSSHDDGIGRSSSGSNSCSATTDSNRRESGKKKLARKKISVKYIEDDDSSSSSSDSRCSSSSSNSSGDEYTPGRSLLEDGEPLMKRTKKSDQGKKKKVYVHESESSSEEEEEEEDEEYTVEKIVRMEVDRNGKKYFFIKWLNYGSEDNTWEPEENLVGCQDIVDEYMEERRREEKKKTTKCVSKALKYHDQNQRPQQSKPRNGIIQNNKNCRRKNGSQQQKIETAMRRSVMKVKDMPQKCPSESYVPESPSSSDNLQSRCSSGVPKSPSSSEISQSSSEAEMKCVEVPFDCAYIGQPSTVFYFRVISGKNNELEYVYIDGTETPKDSDKDVYYRCVVTEDLTGKQPKLIVGATESFDGHKFCLVQFEGHSYVEVIPPENFFKYFPSFKKFFEIHCPHLFV